ncbi:unnamed protein product [marine sediment metagenome]|uniref:Uncharacterized protein n=1 Tax=marine sediment metagenome TaxID=412755 RepID=X1CMW1_9ZZZZ
MDTISVAGEGVVGHCVGIRVEEVDAIVVVGTGVIGQSIEIRVSEVDVIVGVAGADVIGQCV